MYKSLVPTAGMICKAYTHATPASHDTVLGLLWSDSVNMYDLLAKFMGEQHSRGGHNEYAGLYKIIRQCMKVSRATDDLIRESRIRELHKEKE